MPGRRADAPGESLAAGDAILFALAQSAPGQEPEYVKGGDCVRVVLTDVTDLEESDPVTGRALFQLSWEPLGQSRTDRRRRQASREIPPPSGEGLNAGRCVRRRGPYRGEAAAPSCSNVRLRIGYFFQSL